MSDGWYYLEDGKIFGPIPLENLEVILSIVPNPHHLLVWKAGFSDWTIAGAVLGALIPPLPETRGKQASEIRPPPLRPPPPMSQNSTAGDINSSSTVKRRWSLVRAAIWGWVVAAIRNRSIRP